MNLIERLRARRRPTSPAAPLEANPPGQALPPSAVQRGLRLSVIEGLLSTVHINVTVGAFLTGFALLLGAGPLELGLIGALPFVSQLFQFAGAYLEERLGNRRALTVWTAAASRALWGLIAALPFMPGLGGATMTLFLLLLIASQALIGITANAWTSWMSDLVPPRQRGRYFGLRNTVCSVSAMASTWLAGRLLDSFTAAGNDAAGYAIIFGAAVVTALAGTVVLSYQPEPPKRPRARVDVRELFSAPLRHTRFRSLSMAAAGWAIATGIAAPFFNAYGIQTLGLSYTTLALFGVATSAVAVFTQPYIGRLQDRFGNRTVLVVSAAGVVLLPWGWVFSTPSFLLPLWLTSILAGVFWPGITQGLLNLVMDRAPAEGRGAYVASFGAASGVGTFVSGILGGVIASAVGPAVLPLGPFALDQYALLFALSSLGRLAMTFVFARRL
jgi:MFS family permease